MTTVRVRCGCGHTYDHPPPPPVRPAEACPKCQAAATAASDPAPGPADGPFAPGTLFGDFEVLAEINRGGMGAIYKARQASLNRVVALKVILPGRAGTAAALARFQREVQAAAALSHPNIVAVFATDLTAAVPYLVMEYVPGIDLHRLVKAAGPLSPMDAVRYTLQAAEGLQHAHERGLVHRDIKPANLMVTPSPLDPGARRPTVKILDLGLARTADAGTDLTRAGEFLGTPDYVSPEQAQDAASADVRSDLFSLGGSLFYLLTGQPPVPEGNLLAKLSKLITDPPPSVRAARPDVPDGLDRVVRTLLARSPADRYQTPAALIDDLDALLAAGLPGGRPAPVTARVIPVSAPPPPSRVVTPAPGSTTVVAPAVAAAHPGGVKAVAAAGDGDTLVTAGLDGTLRVWDVRRLAEKKRVTGDVGAVAAAAVGPSGGWAVSAAVRMSPADIGVQVWDLVPLKEWTRLKGPTDNPTCLAVDGAGTRIAAGTADKEVWVWPLDPNGGKPARLRGHPAPLAAVVFLPGGDGLLTADEAGQVKQWDLKAKAGKGSFPLTVGRLRGLAFSGLKSKKLAGGGDAGLAVRGRDGAVQPLAGHFGPVRAVAFNPTGTLLASGGADGTVRVWDAAGAEVACHSGFAGPVWCLTWTADGAAVLAGGSDGTLRRWPAPVG
jgi:tRNA A-37 threonylcarbamoyl transferase component Bud32